MEDINIWRVLRPHAKRSCLQQEFAHFLGSWQEEGLRLSDVLKAIASYARSESIKLEPEREQWIKVAILLEAAATEAEIPGNQLP